LRIDGSFLDVQTSDPGQYTQPSFTMDRSPQDLGKRRVRGLLYHDSTRFVFAGEEMLTFNFMDPPQSAPSRLNPSCFVPLGGSLSSNQSCTTPPDSTILKRSKSTVPTQVSRELIRLKTVKTITDVCPSCALVHSNVNVSDQCGFSVSLRTWVCFLTLPSQMLQYGLQRRPCDDINLLPATTVTFTTILQMVAS